MCKMRRIKKSPESARILAMNPVKALIFVEFSDEFFLKFALLIDGFFSIAFECGEKKSTAKNANRTRIHLFGCSFDVFEHSKLKLSV